jgi:putative transposase
MNDLIRLKYAEISWMIETYHSGIKKFCGVERCQARSEKAQRNHTELELRDFLRIEYRSFVKGVSWFEGETSIIIANRNNRSLSNAFFYLPNCVT